MRTWEREQRRAAYSLLEVILAVAILAASGLVLQSMIGQGSRLGLKAEQRTTALELAQTLLDKSLAHPGLSEHEQTGTFEIDPKWAFRMTVEPADSREPLAGMQRTTVEVFPADQLASTSTAANHRATCRLVRWTRRSTFQPPGRSSPTRQQEFDGPREHRP